MKPELIFLIKTIVFSAVLIILDYKLNKSFGPSFIFGLLIENDIKKRIKLFTTGIASVPLAVGIIILIYYKLFNKYIHSYSYIYSIGIVIALTLISFIILRIIMVFYYRNDHKLKPELLIYILFFAGIFTIALGSLIISLPF
jgi:hypothetical protein